MTSVPRATAAPAKGLLGGLARHSVIYSAAPLLRNAIALGMTRFYTGWLGTAGFGIKDTADLWLIGLQQLLGVNALGAMWRFYYEQKDEDARARLVTSCTILVGTFAWLVCGMALCFGGRLTPLMLDQARQAGDVGGAELERIVQLMLVLIPFQLTTASGYYYLFTLKRSTLYTSIQTAKLFLEVGLNFWLIGALGLGVRGFLTSMLVSEALTTLLLCGWMLAKLRPRVDLRVMRPVLLYAAPLIPVGVSQLLMHQVDRRLLLHFTGQSTTGIYGLGYKLAALVLPMVISPFIQIWQPSVFGMEDERERARLVARGSTYGVLAIAVVSLVVIALGRQGVVLLSEKPAFWTAYRIIPLVAAGYVFWMLYRMSEMPLLIAKRTGPLFGINAVAAGLNVVLNLLLIPRMGFVGAGVATLVTFAALAGMGMLASRSDAHVPFELGRLAGIVGCVLVSGALSLWIDELDVGGSLGLPAALSLKAVVLVALLVALWLGVLAREERAALLAWARERVGRSARAA